MVVVTTYTTTVEYVFVSLRAACFLTPDSCLGKSPHTIHTSVEGKNN